MGEVLDSLADLDVDSEEELICNEDSEEGNILPNEDDSCSSSYEEDSDECDEENYIISRDGTQWRETSPSAQRRTLIRNTLRVAPGFAAISKNVDTRISAFQLLSDDSIFNVIIDCSEKKAAQLGHPEWKLKRESLNAFIGILILFGATRGRKESIKCVWSNDGAFCRPIFKTTMERDAFQNILRFIRTDNHETRQERRASDKLVPNSWNLLSKQEQILQEQEYHCQSKQLWHQLLALYHNRFHHQNKLIQEKSKRNRCLFYSRLKDTKYSAKCLLCSAYICPEHTESNVITCSNCNV